MRHEGLSFATFKVTKLSNIVFSFGMMQKGEEQQAYLVKCYKLKFYELKCRKYTYFNTVTTKVKNSMWEDTNLSCGGKKIGTKQFCSNG